MDRVLYNGVEFDNSFDILCFSFPKRADGMVRIQRSLRSGEAGESLALLRAAREVWPENDVFGAADISPEEEFMALREIHFTNLNGL